MKPTLLTAITILLFSTTTAMASGKQLTVMEPVSDRDERSISIEEVTRNIRGEFDRADIFEEDRRSDIDTTRALDAEAERDIYCLTEAIYFESLGEPTEGKIAVANVIMNRAAWKPTNDRNKHHYEFSKEICDVVNFKLSRSYTKRVALGKKKNKRAARGFKYVHRTYTTCAFSYRCERGFHSKLARVKKKPVWNEIKALATEAYLSYNSDENVDPTNGATFYHATWMRQYPTWSRVYRKTKVIGLHKFYKIPD